jgi:hypothetical protein
MPLPSSRVFTFTPGSCADPPPPAGASAGVDLHMVSIKIMATDEIYLVSIMVVLEKIMKKTDQHSGDGLIS